MDKTFQKLTHVLFQTTLGLFVLYFLYEIAAALLIDFPFNQYEPEVVIDAWALSNGMDVYPSRAIGPPAGLYAPFFHIVVAAFFQVLPNTLLTARLVSVLSVLGASWVLFSTIKTLPKAGIVSFIAILMWHPLISMFDLHAKPDSLAVALGMLSVWFVLKEKSGFKELVFAALLSALTVATKQSMLFVPVGIGLALLLFREWKSVLIFGVLFLGFSVVLWWIFSLTLGPDLWFYVFVQPGTFRMRWAGVFINFYMIQSPLPWFLLLMSIPVYIKQKRFSKRYILLFVVSVLALPASVLTASKGGGLSNAYQPFFYFMIWNFLIMISEQWKQGLELETWFKRYPDVAKFSIAVLLVLTIQPNLPSVITAPIYHFQQWKNYEALADKIREKGGSVYVPMDNYLSLKAGSPIRWSYKWQLETSMRDVERKNDENSFSLALKSDQVVTIDNGDWTSDTQLVKKLERNGYHQIESYQMGQIRTYTLWNK
ncbi:hypothetical protein EP331_11340 [bacterium]|nr:MAG: hypothetical protein EP331_11340 [bacterium]